MANYHIKDEASVNAWLQKSEELTQRSNEIMKGVSAVMEEIAHDSKGGLVDNLIQASNAVLQGTAVLVDVMEQITDTIKQVANFFAKAVDAVKEGLTGMLGMFG